jgi:hypothetical protein
MYREVSEHNRTRKHFPRTEYEIAALVVIFRGQSHKNKPVILGMNGESPTKRRRKSNNSRNSDGKANRRKSRKIQNCAAFARLLFDSEPRRQWDPSPLHATIEQLILH